MTRGIVLALASGMMFSLSLVTAAQSPAADTQSAAVRQPPPVADPPAATPSDKLSGPRATLKAANPVGGLPSLPPPPSAKNSTIFGGALRQIDPVRDQFLLDIYGQHPMKVLFDERTQVYRDGVKIPVHDLRPAAHASVQTALDGARIFAISIHILSSIPEGHYRGRVLRFNASTGALRLDASPSPQPFSVLVPGSATIVRQGQSAFMEEGSGRSDLRPGALVDVTFTSRTGSLGVASQIVVLAVPGTSFVFSGEITALDVGVGSLVLVDPRDQKAYQIIFVPAAFPAVRNLRIGERVRINASYDGSAYTASDITVY